LKQRHCCRETLERNGFDAGRGRNRKSIAAAKIRKETIFARAFNCVARMERSVIRATLSGHGLLPATVDANVSAAARLVSYIR
jgi:hypothetical protein